MNEISMDNQSVYDYDTIYDYVSQLYYTNPDFVIGYADAVLSDDEYIEQLVDEISGQTSALTLEFFPNQLFNGFLEEFLASRGISMEQAIRGYLPIDNGFYMLHGIGYAWKEADLYGGDAGTDIGTELRDWLNERGYMIYSY